MTEFNEVSFHQISKKMTKEEKFYIPIEELEKLTEEEKTKLLEEKITPQLPIEESHIRYNKVSLFLFIMLDQDFGAIFQVDGH